MLSYDITYAEATKLAPHLIAIGNTTVYLHNVDGFPWDEVDDIEAGCAYRFSGPAGFYAIAHKAGLEFRVSVDFEGREANGRGVSLFEAGRLRDVAAQLPPAARLKFAQFLTDKVLPDLHKRTEEIRTALQQQEASENCVRGLIAFSTIPSKP